MILAIDPGPERSAWLAFVDGAVKSAMIEENWNVLQRCNSGCASPYSLAIEWVECMGMPVGRETFETVFWVGRFAEAWGLPFRRVTRREVKLHLCGDMRAKDANIRAALIDKFGGSKKKAVGTKKNPGPLYGVKTHLWSALAVAVTASETEAAVAE